MFIISIKGSNIVTICLSLFDDCIGICTNYSVLALREDVTVTISAFASDTVFRPSAHTLQLHVYLISVAASSSFSASQRSYQLSRLFWYVQMYVSSSSENTWDCVHWKYVFVSCLHPRQTLACLEQDETNDSQRKLQITQSELNWVVPSSTVTHSQVPQHYIFHEKVRKFIQYWKFL